MSTTTLVAEAGDLDGAAGVLEVLRSAIHRGELLPGDRLPPERELAVQLGVGRMTLRRALAVLQEEGYLVARRGASGGTFVTSLEEPAARWRQRLRADLAGYQSLHDHRFALETHAARLAAQRRDDDHLARMRASIDLLDGVTDRARFRQLDNDFHNALSDAAASPRLAEAVLVCRAEFFGHADHLDFEELVTALRDEHAAILEAVADADAPGAAAAMAAHLDSSHATLLEILAELP